MKKLVQVQEVEGEGLVSLLGQNVVIFCLNYIYAGKLVGVNDVWLQVEGAKIVYETGPFTDKQWKDAQAIGNPFHLIQIAHVESCGLAK